MVPKETTLKGASNSEINVWTCVFVLIKSLSKDFKLFEKKLIRHHSLSKQKDNKFMKLVNNKWRNQKWC